MMRTIATNGKSTAGEKTITFNFLFCALKVYIDGSAIAAGLRKGAVIDLGAPTIKPDRPYLGANFQPIYSDLGYSVQDSLIQRFANAEHAALHLWVRAARDESFLRAEDTFFIDTTRALAELLGVSLERDIQEGFITNVQLLANGIQPRAIQLGELETAAELLGLNYSTAILAALAFVSYFRAQVRKTFAPARVG